MLVVLVMAAATTPTLPRPPKVLLVADPEIVRRLHSGSEYLTPTVSAAGEIVGCKARLSDGSSFDDRQNCKRLHALRATPARDASGAPVFGTLSFFLSWGIIGEKIKQFTPPSADVILTTTSGVTNESTSSKSRLTLVVNDDGQVQSCDIASTIGNPALDAVACRYGPSAAGVAALHDATGRPVRSVQTLTVGFEEARPVRASK